MAHKITDFLIIGYFIVNAFGQKGFIVGDIINIFTVKPTPTPYLVTKWVGGAYKSCGLDKECVPRHLCLNGATVPTGENFIDLHVDDSVCAYNELCCDLSNKTTEPVIPPVPPIQHDGCGWRNKDGVGFRITGDSDNESQFGEFPWMVAILQIEGADDDKFKYSYVCGGSLIADTVVLTASQCFNKRVAKELVVRGGEWDTQNTNEILSHIDKRVRDIVRHENFSKSILYNDVALLILEEPFKWQENIRPICLPEPSANFDHSRCYATGWGKDNFGQDGKYQIILKKINLPVVPHDTCQINLRHTRLGRFFKLGDSFICAGGEKGKDTCKVDVGSPLVCPIPGVSDRFYQAGIGAWRIACAEENVPGVYANVPYLRQWISEIFHSQISPPEISLI